MRRADGPLGHGGRERSGQYDVELTLELARGAREPSLADKQRVLESLRDRLGSMPSWPPAEHDITGVRRALPEAARWRAPHLARVFGGGVKAAAALQRLALIGAVTGALGFWLGTRNGEGDDTVDRTGQAPATSSAAPASVSPTRAALPSASERCDAPLSRSWGTPFGSEAPVLAWPAPSSVLDALAPSWSATHRGRRSLAPVAPREVGSPAPASGGNHAPAVAVEPALRPAPPAAPRVAAPNAAAPNAAATSARAPLERTVAPRDAQNGSETPRGARSRAAAPKLEKAPFLDAVRLLQRAQRAVDAGEPALAMFLLGELDTQFPRELLSEERATTRVLALCESGQTDRAHQVALELNLQSPSSIYAARIARSCVSLAGSPGASD